MMKRNVKSSAAVLAGVMGAAALILSGQAMAIPPAAGMAVSADSGGGWRIAAAAEQGAMSDSNVAEAKDFVQGMAQKALNFLGDEKMSQAQKTSSFSKLLHDSFDMETIGRYALGRYWRSATPAQKKEYQALFREMVVTVYSNRFHEYRGQKFETRSARADSEHDAVVTSFIVSGQGPDVQVDWRIRQKNGQYKVVDVIVEGVSMLMTQRSDFSSVIQRGGGDIEVLLAHLRDSRKTP